jgi:hypothetical protein
LGISLLERPARQWQRAQEDALVFGSVLFLTLVQLPWGKGENLCGRAVIYI